MSNIDYMILNVNELKKKLPFDVVEMVAMKVYNNRINIINTKKKVFNKWYSYIKIYKLNKYVHYVLYSSDLNYINDDNYRDREILFS